jgi:antitoxin ParD1/3/4
LSRICLMNISVSLTPELIRLIKEKVASGRYGSTSEVVRVALRLLQRAEQLESEDGDALRRAWQEGVASGDAGPLDLAELRRAALQENGAARKVKRRSAR